jgi:16S rRNA (guanine527-N7)-methyltransferase
VTEEEARAAVRSLVGSEGYARLERLAALVIGETERQNLIARSTVATIWNRHILDSVQLLRWVDGRDGLWLDIGTGGGFPGLAIAAATDGEVLLVEPRRLRATFLSNAVADLGLRKTAVTASKVETVTAKAAIISARAVAPIEKLLHGSIHCATSTTRWLMLRGRVLPGELAALARRSDLMFHVEQSVSDAESSIVIADRKGPR